MPDRILARALSSPSLYDAVQWMLGNRILQDRLDPLLATIAPASWLIDLGGGTGLRTSVRAKYVCLDMDPKKVERFRDVASAGRAIVGNACRCPLKDCSVDAVLCAKVTHHLDDGELTAAFAELERVMKPGGTLILADAVASNRWMARLLWAIDRGAHPRRADQIERAFPPTFVINQRDTFRVRTFHDFVLYVATKQASAL